LSGSTKIAIGGVAIAIILFALGLWPVALLFIAAAIALPVGAYLMLDPSQRRRLKTIRRRQIDR
jgi:uncharacterized membrane protein